MFLLVDETHKLIDKMHSSVLLNNSIFTLMSPIKYLIADDDPMYLANTIEQLSLIPNLQCEVACNSGVEANAYLQNHLPDLLILDVEMPGLTGIQLAKSLKTLPFIIFISSHVQYAVDAFEVDAVDYLVKPVSIEKMIRAIEKVKVLYEMKKSIPAQEGFKTENNNSFFIKEKNMYQRIFINEVLYIESLGDFVNIFLENGQKRIALVSLKNIEQQLPSHIFLRISRTHIVNKQRITALNSSSVLLNKIELNIGKSYVENTTNSIIGNSGIKRFI